MSTQLHEKARAYNGEITINDIKYMFEAANLPDDTPVTVFFTDDLNGPVVEYPIQAVGFEANSGKVGIVIMPTSAVSTN